MEIIKENIIWFNSFLNLKNAEEKIDKWIEEDYNKQQIQTTLFKYKDFEKTYYESLIKKSP
jgi:hypothetical protein